MPHLCVCARRARMVCMTVCVRAPSVVCVCVCDLACTCKPELPAGAALTLLFLSFLLFFSALERFASLPLSCRHVRVRGEPGEE